MKFHAIVFLAALEGASAFHVPVKHNHVSSTALFGRVKKARNQQKQSRGRAQQFYDAIEDAQDKKKEKPESDIDKDEERRQAVIDDAQERMDARPEVSTIFVDEESGMEVVRQGQNVLDVVTRKAVKLSDMGPQYRLAQMFPGVPPETREKYRLNWKTVEVPEVVEAFRNAAYVKLEDGSRGLPVFPSVASKAIDFILANRDRLGTDFKDTLGRLTFQAFTEDRDEEARELNELWKHSMLLENHISAPFRQVMQDAEGRVGPNFGNLELKKFCEGDLYERVGNYLVLKGMVAHWEKKVVDADYVEKNPETDENFMTVMSRGDPRRYLPNPPILYTLKECTQVCAMAQQMCKLFVEDEDLYSDFPPEIVFLEDSLKIRGGTALRKYMIDEFCPARGITPSGLIEGMRRLYQQLASMQIDPYADLRNKVEDLHRAMAVGSDDERDIYMDYALSTEPGEPGYFQTYTFNHSKKSLLKFLDNTDQNQEQLKLFEDENNDGDDKGENLFDLGGLFNIVGEREKNLRSEPKFEEDTTPYIPPEDRAAGRPHELGWIDRLNEAVGHRYRLGEVPSGTIIPDEE